MKIYIVMDSEVGEGDNVEYIASTKEKAIEYCKETHKDQFLHYRSVYETDIDGTFHNAAEVYEQTKLLPSHIKEEKDWKSNYKSK